MGNFPKKREEFFMNKKNGILAGILILLCIVAGLFYFQQKPTTATGEKEIAVVVTHADQSQNTFTYQTDGEYLGEVLAENELVDGKMGQYGLFITTVDGETADDSKQQWWCITKGGEKLNTAADTTPIADGDQFELTLTEGY